MENIAARSVIYLTLASRVPVRLSGSVTSDPGEGGGGFKARLTAMSGGISRFLPRQRSLTLFVVASTCQPAISAKHDGSLGPGRIPRASPLRINTEEKK